MTNVGRVFANRYELRTEVGHGGMADVYLARDRLLNRRVAVKVLSPTFAADPTFVERFRREAQAAASLNHPNIVAVYDWGQEDDTSFIVMEYVNGQTLRDLVNRYGTVPPMEAARIGADIADALEFAHRNGVVHRDVKPGNVLITPEGGVKVTDFGIARAESSDTLTKTGAVLGTATYFSPEQAQGLALDGRSDVYSLGVVLYEMLTGVAPFTADSPVSVAYKHVREEPVPPSRVKHRHPGRARSHRAHRDGEGRRASLRRPPPSCAPSSCASSAAARCVGGPVPATAAAATVPMAAARVRAAARPPGPSPARGADTAAPEAPPLGCRGLRGDRVRTADRADRGAPRAIRLRRRRDGRSPARRPQRHQHALPERGGDARQGRASRSCAPTPTSRSPADTVLTQDPEAGLRLRKGRHDHARREQRHRRAAGHRREDPGRSDGHPREQAHRGRLRRGGCARQATGNRAPDRPRRGLADPEEPALREGDRLEGSAGRGSRRREPRRRSPPRPRSAQVGLRVARHAEADAERHDSRGQGHRHRPAGRHDGAPRHRGHSPHLDGSRRSSTSPTYAGRRRPKPRAS